MQFNILGLKIIFLALFIINFSVSAKKSSITYSSEIEKGIEVPVISMTVHDATFDEPRAGKDVTHEYVFRREQIQEGLHIDINNFNSEPVAVSSEPFSSNKEQFHNDSQSSSIMSSTWDPLDDIREARCNSILEQEKYLPEKKDDQSIHSLRYPSTSEGAAAREVLIEDKKTGDGFLWRGCKGIGKRLAFLGNKYMDGIDALGNFFDSFGSDADEDVSTAPPPIYDTPKIDTEHIEPAQKCESFKQIWPDGAIMEQEIHLWQKELEYWPGASQDDAQERYNARCAAYENTKNNPYVFTEEHYQLSDETTELLLNNEIDPLLFTQGIYNPLQHQLHMELVDILELTAQFIEHCAYKKELESSRSSLVSLASIGARFNKIGDAIKTATIADVCWKLAECEWALKMGMANGLINVVIHAWENPHEVALCALAPEVMGGYYLVKLAYNIGAGIKSLRTEGVKQETLDNLTLPGTIQAASTLLASMYLNGKIDRQFVKCGKIAKNAVKEAIKNRDPALCLAGNNSNQVRSQSFGEIPKQQKPSILDVVQEEAHLTNVKKAEHYRDLVKEKQGHIFSRDHKSKGILSLGKDEQDIIESMINKVTLAIQNNRLIEGDNQIFTMINNREVTIRVHIKDGKFISTNLLVGRASRICQNQFEL